MWSSRWTLHRSETSLGPYLQLETPLWLRTLWNQPLQELLLQTLLSQDYFLMSKTYLVDLATRWNLLDLIALVRNLLNSRFVLDLQLV